MIQYDRGIPLITVTVNDCSYTIQAQSLYILWTAVLYCVVFFVTFCAILTTAVAWDKVHGYAGIIKINSNVSHVCVVKN